MSITWRRGLYAITDPTLTTPPCIADEVRAALAGGAVMIQYRDKRSDPVERRSLAGALLRLCREARAPLIINDDIALAAELGADGVHLGRDDGGIEEARARLGPRALIGVSCYNEFARAEAAAGAGADYVAFGRFFPSRTKPEARQADVALLRRARRALAIPIAAIGGIDAANGADLIAAGADLLGVIDGVFGRGDTRVAAVNMSALWDEQTYLRGGEQLSGRTTSPAARCRRNEHEVIHINDGRKIGRIDIEGVRMTCSHDLFQQAQRHIPGGVNSPVRAFRGVGGDPVFFKRGERAYLFDEDGKQYIDYVGSWGPMILGHAHPAVIAAVKEAADNGLGFGAPTTIETEMAEKVCALVPSIELVRMVSSGTEATMSAIRLARGYTGRDKIVKFEGCYHGHSDSLLVKAGSGALTLGVPSSAGVPAALAEHTLTLNYNDLDQVRETFAQLGGQIACIIVEPVAGNMNCVPPKPGFLEGLRAVCDEYESVLIFDEVMTGFRVALGGAQEYYKVTPDLTTLGKVIGGGLPVGAFGGRRAIMEQIAPLGPVYQAGTLSGNPVAMAAGLAMLKEIEKSGFFTQLTERTEQLTQGLVTRAKAFDIPLTTNQVGGMFGLFFTEEKEIRDYYQVTNCNLERFKLFFHGMLEQGVYLAPSAYEAGFVSAAHGHREIKNTLIASEQVFARL